MKTAPLAFAAVILLGILIGFAGSEFRSGAKIDSLEGAIAQYQAILQAPTKDRIVARRTSGESMLGDALVFIPGLLIGVAIGFLIQRKQPAARPNERAHEGRDLRTMTAEPIKSVQKPETFWLFPHVAMKKYFSDEYETYSKALQACLDNQKARNELGRGITASPNPGKIDMATLLAASRRSSDLEANSKSLAAQYEQSETRLLLSFRCALRSGTVIAKGVKVPYVPGQGAVEINADDWALLDFDSADKAYETATAGNITYKGLLFRAS